MRLSLRSSMFGPRNATQHLGRVCFGDRQLHGMPGLLVTDDEFRKVELSSLFAFGAKEPLFRRATADFKNAIRYPNDTGFFCYPAIESLLHRYIERDPSLDKKAAISKLASDLNVDPACLQCLRNLSDEPRHGRAHSISGQDRTRAIRATREILLRFASPEFQPFNRESFRHSNLGVDAPTGRASSSPNH